MDENTETRSKGSSEVREEAGKRRRVWSVEEAARLLGISRAHAYELVARDELPHLRLGRRVVVPKQALEALLAGD